MAKDKKSFVLYADYVHTVKKMSNNKAGALFKVILSYVNDENPVVNDMVVDLVFEPIKRQLKRDLQRWETTSVKRSAIGKEAGKKSGEARRTKMNQNEPIGSNTNQNEHVTVTVTDTVTDTVINISFDVFWNLYDKKFDRPKCAQKWLRLSDEERESIIQYLPNYKLSQPDKKYRKNPLTFLNNKSWENEIINSSAPKIQDHPNYNERLESETQYLLNCLIPLNEKHTQYLAATGR